MPKIPLFLRVYLLAVIVSILAYPEIFLFFKLSMMRFGDYKIEYFNTAIIINFISQGGIQLWDHFGQMPYAYLFTTLGTFKFPNVTTAVAYSILSPFSAYKGVLFHHVFTWVNMFTLLLLRVWGIFLVLRCFVKDSRILAMATVLFSVFFCQAAFVVGTFYQSFYPIFMYFVLRFVDTMRLRDLAAAGCFLVISFGNSPLYLGYLYLGLHFFVLSAAVYTFIYRRKEWKNIFHRLAATTLRRWKEVLLLLAGLIVIAGPFLWLRHIALSDVEFGLQNSRIGSMFNIHHYFHGLDIAQADPSKLFVQMLDPSATIQEGYFYGLMFIALSIVGVVLSKDKRKWIFASSVAMLWLLNFPREGWNIGLLAHWINVLTNPFKSFVRTYHLVTISVLPYLFFPLVIMGIKELLAIFWKREDLPVFKWKTVLTLVTLFSFVSLFGLPRQAQMYVLAAWGGMALTGIAVLFDKDKKFYRWFLVAWCLIGAVDITLACLQAKRLVNENTIAPYDTITYNNQGSLGVEFENPGLFPLRENGSFEFKLQDSLLQPAIGQTSDYFQFTNFLFDYFWIDGHNPRHKSFATFNTDREMSMYLTLNHRMFFDAPQAVKAGQGTLTQIVENGLAQDTVMVEDPLDSLHLPVIIPVHLPLAQPSPILKVWEGTMGTGKILDYGKDRNLNLLSFALPADFPWFLATSYFTEDRDLMQVLVMKADGSWQELGQVQGEFERPYLFDVQHVKEGTLTLSLPRDGFSPATVFKFFYPALASQALLSVWKKQFDNLGITYTMSHQGWFVFQYPYDKKWKLYVDDKPAEYYKVNKAFIGFPLASGRHRIYLQYEPGTLLRPWLLASVLVTSLGLIALMLWGFRWEK